MVSGGAQRVGEGKSWSVTTLPRGAAEARKSTGHRRWSTEDPPVTVCLLEAGPSDVDAPAVLRLDRWA